MCAGVWLMDRWKRRIKRGAKTNRLRCLLDLRYSRTYLGLETAVGGALVWVISRLGEVEYVTHCCTKLA